MMINERERPMSDDRPNILFIMSDDHASHAMSCYGSRINRTPNLDRIADGGMRFDNCFCTNSICTPSRAAILTGTYNHVNGVTTLATPMDNRLLTFPKLLQESGYQTAIFGKWHLGTGPDHCPTGFDDWAVLPGQGRYHNPEFIFKGPDGGDRRTVRGYVTDLITDMSLDWLRGAGPGPALLPALPPQGAPPPLVSGREARAPVPQRGHPRAGDALRRLPEPRLGRGRGRDAGRRPHEPDRSEVRDP